MVEKLVSDPFIKNKNWAYLGINFLKCYKVCFYCMSSRGLRNCINLYKVFWKNKKRSGTSVPTWFSAWFLKIFCHAIFICWPKFIGWLPLLHEILGNMCIVIVCCPVCYKFSKLTLAFSSSRFSTYSKSQNKNVNISWNKGLFHHF